MTKEQYDKVKVWMDKRGLCLDFQTLGELDTVLQQVKGDDGLILKMDKDSLVFDATKTEDAIRGFLKVILGEDEKCSEALEQVLNTTVGHVFATDNDVVGQLKNFCAYVIDRAMEIKNEQGLRKGKEEAKQALGMIIRPSKAKS